MEKKYFIVRNGQKYGAFTKEELVEARITEDTLIWYEGLGDWTEAKKLQELSDLFSYQSLSVQAENDWSIQGERIGNVVYHLDNEHVTLFTSQGEIYYRYADFGERFLGLLIDRLICVILAIFPIIGAWLYYAILHSSDGQATVGQRAMNIQCLSEEGNRIDFGQATGRFFMSLVSGLIFLIGYFLYFGSNKKQTLHDSVAKTLVVKEIGRKNYNF